MTVVISCYTMPGSGFLTHDVTVAVELTEAGTLFDQNSQFTNVSTR